MSVMRCSGNERMKARTSALFSGRLHRLNSTADTLRPSSAVDRPPESSPPHHGRAQIQKLNTLERFAQPGELGFSIPGCHRTTPRDLLPSKERIQYAWIRLV